MAADSYGGAKAEGMKRAAKIASGYLHVHPIVKQIVEVIERDAKDVERSEPEKYVEIGSLYRGRYSAIQFLQSAQSIPQLGAHGSLPVYMKVTGDDATNGRPTNV